MKVLDHLWIGLTRPLLFVLFAAVLLLSRFVQIVGGRSSVGLLSALVGDWCWAYAYSFLVEMGLPPETSE